MTLMTQALVVKMVATSSPVLYAIKFSFIILVKVFLTTVDWVFHEICFLMFMALFYSHFGPPFISHFTTALSFLICSIYSVMEAILSCSSVPYERVEILHNLQKPSDYLKKKTKKKAKKPPFNFTGCSF